MSNIRITKKQNVVVDGVKYVARDFVLGDYGCTACAFNRESYSCEVAPCIPPKRSDRREVIFVRKAPKL